MTTGTKKTVTVYQMHHNGACWEHIEGASWDMDILPGESFRDAVLRESPCGDWPDDDGAGVGLVARDDESGADYIATETFTAGELRGGR